MSETPPGLDAPLPAKARARDPRGSHGMAAPAPPRVVATPSHFLKKLLSLPLYRVAPSTSRGTPSRSRPLSPTSLSPTPSPVATRRHALCVPVSRGGAREPPRRWPSRAGVPGRRGQGRAVPSLWHPARLGAAKDRAPGAGTPARPLPPAAAAEAPAPACSGRPGRTATRGAHGPRPHPARAHLGGAGPVAPIAPPRRLRISRAPARRPPGRPSVPAGAKEGGGDARRPRGPGAAGAASCRPQPSRKFVRPGPAAASAPARAPAPAPRRGRGPAQRGAGATPGVRRGERIPGAGPTWKHPTALDVFPGWCPFRDTLAGPPLPGPRREPRVAGVTGTLTCGKGPACPRLGPGHQEVAWLRTSFGSCTGEHRAPCTTSGSRSRESREISRAGVLLCKDGMG